MPDDKKVKLICLTTTSTWYGNTNADAVFRINFRSDTQKEMIPTGTAKKILPTTFSITRKNNRPEKKDSNCTNKEKDNLHILE